MTGIYDRWPPSRCVLRKPVLTLIGVLGMAFQATLLLAEVLTFPTGEAVFLLPAFALALLAIRRISVLGVVIDHRGVTVRNFFRNIRLEWSQIVVAEPPHGYGYRTIGVRLVLTDGRVVRCGGLQPGNLERLSASDRFVDILNAAIQAHHNRRG